MTEAEIKQERDLIDAREILARHPLASRAPRILRARPVRSTALLFYRGVTTQTGRGTGARVNAGTFIGVTARSGVIGVIERRHPNARDQFLAYRVAQGVRGRVTTQTTLADAVDYLLQSLPE